MHESVTIGAQYAGGEGPPHGHDPHLAHHFDTPQQQFDAGKLGMWLFLVTEILFFSGLFTAYAVYRSNHPEVFLEAHKYLDKVLGAVNTIVLLLSSLTMAWGVRCAQLGRNRGLVWCLTATLMCASLFLGIKAVEYTHKWDLGLYWGKSFAPVGAEAGPGDAQSSHHAPRDESQAVGNGQHGYSRTLLYLCVPAALAFLVCGAKALVSRTDPGVMQRISG